jgi:hypothetical protein
MVESAEVRLTMNGTKNLLANFEAATRECFRFLEDEYQMSVSILRPHAKFSVVRYKGSSTFVNLTYGPPAYEPEMSFGRPTIDDGAGSYSFDVGDLIQLNTCGDWRSISSSTGLEHHVAWLASILKLCGRQCLDGNQSVYDTMKAKRNKLIAEWQDQEQLLVLSRSIDEAWKQRDYKKIIALCSHFSDKLDVVNSRRLAYARSQN